MCENCYSNKENIEKSRKYKRRSQERNYGSKETVKES